MEFATEIDYSMVVICDSQFAIWLEWFYFAEIMKFSAALAEIAQLVVVCDSYSQGRWFEPNSRYNFKWCTTFGIRFVKAL